MNDSFLSDLRTELNTKNDITVVLEQCREAIKSGKYTLNDEFWFLYGKALWQAGERRQAAGAYRMAVELNPGSPAAIALEMSDNIDEFFNPDLLNP